MPTHKISEVGNVTLSDVVTGKQLMSFKYPEGFSFTISAYDKSYYLDPNNIEKVVFNDPATIVIFKNGEKTIVKTMEGEEFNHEVGFLYAMAKHLFDSRGEFVRFIEKWKEEDK